MTHHATESSSGCKGRGGGFYVNVLIAGCLGLLTVPLFDHYSAEYAVFHYSRGYALFLTAFSAPPIALLASSLALSAEANKKMAWSLFLTWALTEILLSFLIDTRPFQQSQFYRRPAPYVMFTGLPHGRWTDMALDAPRRMVTYTLNGEGFRGPAPSMPKPGGEYRVFTIGGSVVFNGDPLEETIAGHLQTALREQGVNGAKVYKWGVVSFVSGQELALIVHRVADFNPDLVVVLDGYNDLSQPYGFDPRPGYPLNFVTVEEGLDRVEAHAPLHKLIASVLYKSHTLRLIYGRFQPDILVPIGIARERASYRTLAWEDEIVRTYLNNLRKIAAVSDGFGFTTAFFLQPPLVLKQSLVGGEQKILTGGDFDEYMRRQLGKAKAGIADLASSGDGKRTCACFDLSDLFRDSREDLFVDPVHITNHGNKLVADAIAARLRDRGLVH